MRFMQYWKQGRPNYRRIVFGHAGTEHPDRVNNRSLKPYPRFPSMKFDYCIFTFLDKGNEPQRTHNNRHDPCRQLPTLNTHKLA